MIFLSRFAPRLIDGLFLLVLLKIALAADGTRTDSSHSRNEDSTDGCNCDRHSVVTVVGSPGIPGQKGETGADGMKGDAGRSGKLGPEGLPGQKGETGADGMKGDAGRPGNLGPIGLPGLPGPRGLSGPKGYSPEVNGGKVCSSQLEGLMRYNQQGNGVEYCNGSYWLTLSLLPLLGSSPHLPASSCKEIATTYRSSFKNGQYWIKPSWNEPAFPVYCDASEGWTLIMKINGNSRRFDYDSAFWSNKDTFQSTSLSLDDKEAKLASYWTLPFTELRLGMKVSGVTRWITISYNGSSLYSLIADGQYRKTSVGKSTWRSLLPRSSMQSNCNKEGFNVKPGHSNNARARLGFISNQQNDCVSTNSFTGFGTAYTSLPTNSAGNYACCAADNGDLNAKAMGYIFAR